MLTIHKFNKVDSTNEVAKKYPHNSIIIADFQTKGKGRFNRTWSSDKGGVYLSIVIKPKTHLIQHYTFIASLATFYSLKKFNNNIKIKWPNDLIINKKKMCGILTQNIFFKNKKKTIIGIGINTNNKLPKYLSNKAISLNKITNEKINNNLLIKDLIKNFKNYLKKYEKHGFKKIKEEWVMNSDLINQKVKIKTINKSIIGLAMGVDDQCKLIIKQKNNKKIKIIEGDLFYL